MKKTVIAYLVILSFACNTNRHMQNSQIGLINLNHYYLKNSVSLNKDYTGIVVTSKTGFSDIFYIGNATDNQIMVPDFSGQMVVALAINTIDENSNIIFSKAAIYGKHLNVYGNVSAAAQQAETVPTAIAAVPKSTDIRDVNFYIAGKLVKTSPLPNVNTDNVLVEANSQKQQQSMIKNIRRRPAVI